MPNERGFSGWAEILAYNALWPAEERATCAGRIHRDEENTPRLKKRAMSMKAKWARKLLLYSAHGRLARRYLNNDYQLLHCARQAHVVHDNLNRRLRLGWSRRRPFHGCNFNTPFIFFGVIDAWYFASHYNWLRNTIATTNNQSALSC